MRRASQGRSAGRWHALGALLLLAAVSAPGRAHAFEIPERVLLGGLSLGLLGDGEAGVVAGAELSYVQQAGDAWYWGGFTDVRYDQVARGVMVTLGPELFFAYLGIDLGFVVRTGREGTGLGARGRLCGSLLGVVSLCGGGGYESVRGAFGELSLLAKFPGVLD